MELRQLRYFVAAAEEEHFHRAAQRLGIPQPALTRHIGALERRLGFQLFDRLPRGVRLSVAGRAFRQRAADIVERYETAREEGVRIAAGQQGSLRVGYSEITAWHPLVLSAFEAFRADAPDVRVKLVAGASEPLLEQLRRGKLDAAFVFSPGVPGEFGRAPVGGYLNLVAAVPRSHLLARRAKLRRSDLVRQSFVWMTRELNPDLYDQVWSALLAGGEGPKLVQESDSLETLIGFVAQGIAISVLPAELMRERVAGVVLLPIVDVHIPMQLALVWRENDRTPVCERFVKQVMRRLRAKQNVRYG